MNNAYHIPVLLHESINALAIRPNGIYVDLTFGGGGHSKAILEQLSSEGKLFAFDQDNDAHKNAFADKRFFLWPQNFRHFKKFLRISGVTQVDGILADLGISSYQIDKPERGFSIRSNAPLDMRMDTTLSLTAFDVVNQYSEKQLIDVFSRFGEVRNAKQLAAAILASREINAIATTEQLVYVAKG
ncbi:MAG: 16S rRNA (cytosine(1402)-N(4))-methyltransferase RsmH, partial [Chitinophagales bacterium]